MGASVSPAIAIYRERRQRAMRLAPEHFKTGLPWAKANKLGWISTLLLLASSLSADGFTLSHANDEIRQSLDRPPQSQPPRTAYFWRTVGHAVGDEYLVPDGMKRYNR
ncbi:L-rhamnose isomerase [Klebsiella pneumoniae]|nr:L-rhamnose isomerase [Klebsiella pneumoniae]